MKYEKELTELFPMLEKYLNKLLWKYTGMIDSDEIFSQAMIKIVERTQKRKGIRDPEKFITGIFKRAVADSRRSDVRYDEAISRFAGQIRPEVDPDLRERARVVLDDIDAQVAVGSKKTARIWKALKKEGGNRKKVLRALRIPEQSYYHHKRKIDRMYEKAKKNCS